MSNQLTPTDLMRQARDTAETYFNQAVRIIDEKFGEGYAKEHPELIAGFMNTTAKDFDTCMTRQALDHLSNNFDRLAGAVETLAECQSFIDSNDINNLCNQMDKSSGAIAASLESIASTVDRFLPPVEEFISFMPRGKR